MGAIFKLAQIGRAVSKCFLAFGWRMQGHAMAEFDTMQVLGRRRARCDQASQGVCGVQRWSCDTRSATLSVLLAGCFAELDACHSLNELPANATTRRINPGDLRAVLRN